MALCGRDSRIHVTDYPIGEYSLLHFTAEVFTWQSYEDRTVAVVYVGDR